MSGQRWLPLESNPDVLNKYAYGLGMDQKWEFVDVYGLEPDLLQYIPQPVLAVVFLYPTDEMTDGVEAQNEKPMPNEKIYHIKQTIGNACGTIAMVHTLANCTDRISFGEATPFRNFLEATKSLNSSERATYLEKDKDMGAAHEGMAQEGQTQAPSLDDKVNTHFIALIHKDGGIFEMDGRKENPIRHADSTPGTFLQDAVKVVKKFMERNPDKLTFNLMALVEKK